MVWLSLILVFIAVFAIEAPALIKNYQWKEFAAFAVILILGMTLSVAQVLRLNFPTPTDITEVIFKPISEMVESLLKVSD